MYTREQRKKVEEILQKVADEITSARSKFRTFEITHEGYGVLLEEVHELWDLVRKAKGTTAGKIPVETAQKMLRESIQIAAMAVCFGAEIADPPEAKNETIPAELNCEECSFGPRPAYGEVKEYEPCAECTLEDSKFSPKSGSPEKKSEENES